jgi:hypothetical protein
MAPCLRLTHLPQFIWHFDDARHIDLEKPQYLQGHLFEKLM